jgi:hypothetical protein
MKPWIKWAAVFLAGLFSGGALTAWGIHHSFNRMHDNMNNPAFLLSRLDRKLGLTEDQKSKLLPLLKDSLSRIDSLHQETGTKSKALWDSFEASLRKMLDPVQLKKFDEMKAKWKDHKGFHIGIGGFPMFPGPPTPCPK